MTARLAPEPLAPASPARAATAAARPLGQALARGAGASLAEQLASLYAERISQRLMAPGARLPSVRDGARRHSVSPATVVAAYDMLLAQGLVDARRQRGFFVREPRPAGLSAAASRDGPGAVRPVDATALIRGMFQGGGLAGPGAGTLPPEWLDLPLLQRAMRSAMDGDDSALRYGEPAGDAGLRSVLASRLAEIGVAAAPSQIVTTVGATQALDIVSRTLLAPGDAVLVDEPGWAVEFARLSRMGMKLLPVPRGNHGGPDLAVMRSHLQSHRPRLYITVSVLHNPTGVSLPLAAAHQVLRLAEEHDLTIVEDDTYAHLAPAHAPRLCALDELRRTVYVSGFSKILTPSWRVGYIAAPAALVERFVDTKLLSTLSTPTLPERAIARVLERGSLRRHAERITLRLDAARARVRRLAQDAGCHFVTPPQGLFGWLDVGVDTERLAHTMMDGGWLLAPGTLFHATPRPSTLMRVNFATAQEARFWRALVAARVLA